MARDRILAGRSILVVEDEMSIAVLIEEILRGLGCAVVGPVAKLRLAMQLAANAQIDAAILDVHVRGGEISPVADLLRYRNIPFTLASGYGEQDLPLSLQGERCLTKPSTCREIEDEVTWLCLERHKRLAAGTLVTVP